MCVVKSISIKSKNGIRNAVYYIMAPHKVSMRGKKEKDNHVPGVKLTARDYKHLASERTDYLLLGQLKEFKGTITQFIQQELIGKNTIEVQKLDALRVVGTHNIHLRSKEILPKDVAKAFMNNEQYRERISSRSSYGTHTILSFSPQNSSQLTEPILHDLARQYINLRGPKGIFNYAGHFDKGHFHIHIIESPIEYRTKKSTRISKEKFKEIKNELQRYQERLYPFLKESVVNHQKRIEKSTKAENFYKTTADRSLVKNDVVTTVRQLLNTTKSSEDFMSKLKASKLEIYYRAGKATGVISDGLKFRFTRLGVSEKLKELDTKLDSAKQSLKELQGIRNRAREHTQTRRHSTTIDKQEKETSPLEEISAIRESRTNEEERQHDSGTVDSLSQEEPQNTEQKDMSDTKATDTIESEETDIDTEITDFEE